MYLAHSALRSPEQTDQLQKFDDPEKLLRYRAYINACNKHARQLAIIQQYLPGWMPKFR